VLAVAPINVWNRIAIPTRMAVPPLEVAEPELAKAAAG
jgi:hypothetical protein